MTLDTESTVHHNDESILFFSSPSPACRKFCGKGELKVGNERKCKGIKQQVNN